MKRTPLNRGKPLERKSGLPRGNGALERKDASEARRGVQKRKGISPATPAQRKKVRESGCLVCGPLHDDFLCGPIDPAHLIPRSLLTEGQDDPLAVVGLGRNLHDRYDRRAQPFLDLLPFLSGRPELDFAISRYGHDRAIWRISNVRPA